MIELVLLKCNKAIAKVIYLEENKMQNNDEFIGKNIKEVRKEKGLSQQALADKCGFANTVLSAYENSKKIPNLTTIATIARALDVSIERLYYGDDNNAFINMVSDEGRKIVNSIYLLWDLGVISYFENLSIGMSIPMYGYSENDIPNGFFLNINEYVMPIKRFINSLDEFKQKRDTYPEPDMYLEMLKASIATEINNEKLEKLKSKGRD